MLDFQSRTEFRWTSDGQVKIKNVITGLLPSDYHIVFRRPMRLLLLASSLSELQIFVDYRGDGSGYERSYPSTSYWISLSLVLQTT